MCLFAVGYPKVFNCRADAGWWEFSNSRDGSSYLVTITSLPRPRMFAFSAGVLLPPLAGRPDDSFAGFEPGIKR